VEPAQREGEDRADPELARYLRSAIIRITASPRVVAVIMRVAVRVRAWATAVRVRIAACSRAVAAREESRAARSRVGCSDAAARARATKSQVGSWISSAKVCSACRVVASRASMRIASSPAAGCKAGGAWRHATVRAWFKPDAADRVSRSISVNAAIASITASSFSWRVSRPSMPGRK
jgi:hypothetical protein